MSSPERIAELMFLHQCGELSAKQKAELLAWRNLSPANETVFRNGTDPDRLASSMKRLQDNKEIIFNKIMARQYAPVPAAEIRRFRIEKIMRFAAIFVVSLGILLYLGSINIGGNDDEGHADPNNLATFTGPDGVATAMDDMHRGYLAGYAGIKSHTDKNGQLIYVATDRPHAAKDKNYKLQSSLHGRLCFLLPDSSLVWLNSQSSIQYPANFFAGAAPLVIEGEAYIEPAKSRKTALRLRLRGMEITTGASRFNVRAYPNDAVSIVTLLDGDLRIRQYLKAGASSPEVELQPAEQARVFEDSLQIVRHVDVDQVIAWKTKKAGAVK